MSRWLSKSIGVSYVLALSCIALFILASVFPVHSAYAQVPSFSKQFSPATIGPGSTSTLTFQINHIEGSQPATDLAFTDNLPAEIKIATPASATTDCTDGIVSAPDNGDTISFSDGRVGAQSSCTVSVNVVGTATATNTSGDLTSSEGTSSPAVATLTVNSALPGFSKYFTPPEIALGARSRLTINIDNSANGSVVSNLDFTDILPDGMVIAGPANAWTNCGTATIPPTLTAPAGGSVITLDANGTAGFPAVASGAICTVAVDVIGNAIPSLINVSGDLLADFVSAGKATAALDVTITPLHLSKSFTNDPVPPGGNVILEFFIENLDREFPTTDIGFSDDLATGLAGLTFDSVESNECGGTVAGAGTTTITFSGDNLAAETSCAISVSLSVPGGATPGSYENTTGNITGTIDGSPVIGNQATETLYVEPVPLLTKSFTDDPVGAGDDVTLQFTIANTSSTSAATDITFLDELTDNSSSIGGGGGGNGFLPFPVSVTLPPVPNPPCGADSSLALVGFDTDRQRLELTGGSLATAGTAGDACTFEVTVEIPAGFPGGTYSNTTQAITATVDGAIRTGLRASDDIVVVGAPQLTKEFTDDPVVPGNPVTLEFTLTHDATAPGDATDVAFSDDLDATLGDLVATGALENTCGGMANSFPTGLFDYAGGTLAPGTSCIIRLTLDVPAAATSGNYSNSTSEVTATVDAIAVTGNVASDDLSVSALIFTKEFLDDPVVAGGTATLRFTIANNHPVDDATITSFTDDLSAALPGLSSTGAPSTDTCGGALSGTTFLTYVGGTVGAGSSCMIDVELLVPLATTDGTYSNITSPLSSDFGTSDPAADDLVVNSTLLELTKEFTNDPAVPGGTVLLSFDVKNLSDTDSVTDIAFSDDLDAALSGLMVTGAPINNCGGMNDSVDAGIFDYSGGSLAPGETCNITLELTIPTGAPPDPPLPPGPFINTTSDVTGLVGALDVRGDPASDELNILGGIAPALQKLFIPEVVAAGSDTNLTFTISNPASGAVASNLSFSDDLAIVIPGLAAYGLPLAEACDPDGPGGDPGTGTMSTDIAGLLTFVGGVLAPGQSCEIEVPVEIPLSATVGTFLNTTSTLREAGVPVSGAAEAKITIAAEIGIAVTGGASGINCVENIVAGFDTATSGCGFEIGTRPVAGP